MFNYTHDLHVIQAELDGLALDKALATVYWRVIRRLKHIGQVYDVQDVLDTSRNSLILSGWSVNRPVTARRRLARATTATEKCFIIPNLSLALSLDDETKGLMESGEAYNWTVNRMKRPSSAESIAYKLLQKDKAKSEGYNADILDDIQKSYGVSWQHSYKIYRSLVKTLDRVMPEPRARQVFRPEYRETVKKETFSIQPTRYIDEAGKSVESYVL